MNHPEIKAHESTSIIPPEPWETPTVITKREMERLNLKVIPHCVFTHPITREETAFNSYGGGETGFETLWSGMVDQTIKIIIS